MNILTTRRNHLIAARFFALAADARRSALENGADREIAALHADQARVMKARAVAARNGTRINQQEDAVMTITEFDGFAVYQIGYAIYGVGLDADSARSDAAEWLGDDGDDAGSVPAYRPGAFVSGDTVVIQCTAALVAQVERDGGADGFRETRDEVGRLALCTEEEAEADAESEA